MRVALYLRVSTDEQAERETIDAQSTALTHWVNLHSATAVHTYVDDGISGTLKFDDRPSGTRLLADAKTRRFDAVVAFKVDRLARSLTILLELYACLEPLHISIISATEPFDTSTPFGKFLFQFLGSMAEFNKSMIIDQLTRGRDRVARTGKLTNGVVPYGYMLDAGRCLTPSTRPVMGMREAELVQRLFARMAHGSTMVAECVWLNQQGVPATRRYASGKEIVVAPLWTPARLASMFRNKTYIGQYTLKSRHGTVVVSVPRLIDDVTWQRTQQTIEENLTLPTHGERSLLRGLVRCVNCGRAYVAGWSRQRNGEKIRYYRCNGPNRVYRAPYCGGKMIRMDVLDDYAWQAVERLQKRPSRVREMAALRRQQHGMDAEERKGERERLQRAMAEKARERERMMVVYRRGMLSVEELTEHLEAVEQEHAALQAQLRMLEVKGELDVEEEDMLARIEDILRHPGQTTREEMIRLLIRGITIETTKEGRRKHAVIRVYYKVFPGDDVALTTTSVSQPDIIHEVA